MTKKQRRRVWGSVTEMRRGKKYVLRWMQNTPQGRRRKTKTVYGTYREACAELDRIHVEHADDAPVPTIAKAYETWLVPKMAAQVEAATLAPNTRDLVLRSWKNYVGPRWGAMPVDQLRAVELQGWLLTLPAATADTALLTLRKVYACVSTFIRLPLDPFAASVRYTMPPADPRALKARLHPRRGPGRPRRTARQPPGARVHPRVFRLLPLGRVAGRAHRGGTALGA